MIRTNVKKASSDNSLIIAASKFESAVTAIIDGKVKLKPDDVYDVIEV